MPKRVTESLAGFESLLRRVSIPITAGAQVGSGFFVAPNRIITCAHVIAVNGKPAKSIISYIDSAERDVEVVESSFLGGNRSVDLVLLKIADNDFEHPYAALAPAVEIGDELWVWGYPDSSYRNGDSAILRYQGASTREDDVELMKTDGSPLSPGFSGAPVINLRTGAVCGVVRLGSRQPSIIRLTSSETILKTYDELRRYHQMPYQNKYWLDCLSDEQLRHGKISYPGPRMRKYLGALRAAVDNHPYAVPLDDAPPLTHVYLRQRGVRTDRSMSNDEGVIFLPGPHRRGSSDSADSQELFIRHRNTLLIGRPGSGKSSLLRYIAGHASTAWLDEASGKFVPAYVPAIALTSPNSFASTISAAVSSELGNWIDESIPPNWFAEEPLPGIPWLLLIDGVDEILDSRRRKAVLDAIAFRNGAGIFRFLVASRPLGENDIKGLLSNGISTYEILPFSPDQLLILAKTWFHSLKMQDADQQAEEFRRSLERSRIAPLACVPLIASMLCLVFLESPEPRIPESRADLYEEFIRVLMSKQYEQINIFETLVSRVARYGPHARVAVEKLLDASRSLIERLAFDWYKGGKRHSLDLLEDWSSSWRPAQMPRSEWRKVLGEMLRQSGILVQRGKDFRFIHLTIQEYMAATYEASGIQAQTANVLVFSQGHREQSYRLFLAAICSRRGVSFDVSALQLMNHGSADSALFIAALSRDGITLSEQVIRAAVSRLERITAIGASRVYGIDVRIQAAHELAFLSPEKGANALGRLTNDRHVAGYDRAQAARQLVDLDFSLGTRILRQQVSDYSIGGPERMLIAQYLLDLDPDAGISALEELVRDPRMNGWARLDIVDELSQWDSKAAMDALIFLARDQNLEDYCRSEAYEKVPFQIARKNGLKETRLLGSHRGKETDSSAALDYAEDLLATLKSSGKALTRLAEVISDPESDSFAKKRLLEGAFNSSVEATINWATESYDTACARVYVSLGDDGVTLGVRGRNRTASRLAMKLDRKQALITLVRLETLKICDPTTATCPYGIVVAKILMEISNTLIRDGNREDALSGLNAAHAIYRACASLGLDFEEELRTARRLVADLRRPAKGLQNTVSF